MVDAFKMNVSWPERKARAKTPLAASFAHMQIIVDGINVSAFKGETEEDSDHLELPCYYLAEWIAENWWALLWEPRKSEDKQESDLAYDYRHSMLAAQHGFVLPAVSFTPSGENVSVYCRTRDVNLAGIRFRSGGNALVLRDHVEHEFRNFVDATVAQFADLKDNSLRQTWDLVKNTDEASSLFCRLMGCLGLSPYEKHETLERALDAASDILSETEMFDLCLGATAEDLILGATVAATMRKEIGLSPTIDLGRLQAVTKPSDVRSAPAWHTGYKAARRLREHFNIRDEDAFGADAVFEALSLHDAINFERWNSASSPVVGATYRTKDIGQVALVQNSRQNRRFTAARSAYFLWDCDNENRLITGAVTRDQQASRSFAAELLVPQAYIRSKVPNQKLRFDQVDEIAQEIGVASEVIKLQAQNAGLQVGR